MTADNTKAFAIQAALGRDLRAQRNAVEVEPIHAALEPVRAYAKHITEVTKRSHHVVVIPNVSAAYRMGYRFASAPDEEIEHYLENGATLAEEEQDVIESTEMSDYGDLCKYVRGARSEARRLHGVPCPECERLLPKASPSILLPQQRCRIHGYRDPRPRNEQRGEK